MSWRVVHGSHSARATLASSPRVSQLTPPTTVSLLGALAFIVFGIMYAVEAYYTEGTGLEDIDIKA